MWSAAEELAEGLGVAEELVGVVVFDKFEEAGVVAGGVGGDFEVFLPAFAALFEGVAGGGIGPPMEDVDIGEVGEDLAEGLLGGIEGGAVMGLPEGLVIGVVDLVEEGGGGIGCIGDGAGVVFGGDADTLFGGHIGDEAAMLDELVAAFGG